MCNLLITGGCGYIGSHTIVELLNKDYQIHVVDNLSNSKLTVLDGIKHIVGDQKFSKITFHQVDLIDKEKLDAIFKQHSFVAVIHFAGLKAVGESVSKPLLYYQNNITGTLNLLEVMQNNSCKNIVFSSSATVYGEVDPKNVPVDENHRTSVTNPYGQTKLMIENILLDLQKSDPEWHVVILRYFNPIGAHESGLIGENPLGIPNNIMPYLQQVASGKLPYFTIFGNNYSTPDGTGIRDYIHVVDLAKGHISALIYILAGSSGIFNLGTGNGYSVLELISTFEEVTGKKINYKIGERRTGDVAVIYANPDKAQRELGWVAEKKLQEMCATAWKWQMNSLNQS